MINKLYIFLIIIITFIITIVIGLSITKLIDNKIKNATIIIPKKKIEPFIVADAQQNIHNYEKLKQNTLKLSDSFESDKIEQPNKNEIVQYKSEHINDNDFYIGLKYNKPYIPKKPKNIKNNKMSITSADFGWSPPRQFVSCANSSIARKYKTGKKNLAPFNIDCNKPNKLTAENYYKLHYNMPVIPLEDHLTRGYNYMSYSNTVEPGKIDFRILSQSTKGLPPNETKIKNLPVGSNYAFHNTPMMRMP